MKLYLTGTTCTIQANARTQIPFHDIFPLPMLIVSFDL
jgi:hypothetical protein